MKYPSDDPRMSRIVLVHREAIAANHDALEDIDLVDIIDDLAAAFLKLSETAKSLGESIGSISLSMQMFNDDLRL